MLKNFGMIGHDWAIEHLQGQIKSDRLRHAYLITGPAGIGKQALALGFSKALNCFEPPQPGEFCSECRYCYQTSKNGHPDQFIVERILGDKDLKVGAIRSLQRNLSLAPYDAQYRVAILSNFQYASTSASNALLKTLEEPAKQVILIITADTPEALLPTIVSRCEHIRLRPLPINTLTQELSQRDIPVENAKLFAHVSAGRPEYAIQIASDESIMSKRNEQLDQLIGLLNSNRHARFKFVVSITKDKSTFINILQIWTSFWRDIFLKQFQPQTILQNPDRDDQIIFLANNIEQRSVEQFMVVLQKTANILETNANARLAAEILMLKMPYQSI